jgi:pimeloyl-ACP methyl ester carboxylesterase
MRLRMISLQTLLINKSFDVGMHSRLGDDHPAITVADQYTCQWSLAFGPCLILVLLTGAALAASSPAHAAVKTIVLVHGAFADGSGWKPVADILQSHGYSVLVVQEPETNFAADVAATRRVLQAFAVPEQPNYFLVAGVFTFCAQGYFLGTG